MRNIQNTDFIETRRLLGINSTFRHHAEVTSERTFWDECDSAKILEAGAHVSDRLTVDHTPCQRPDVLIVTVHPEKWSPEGVGEVFSLHGNEHNVVFDLTVDQARQLRNDLSDAIDALGVDR